MIWGGLAMTTDYIPFQLSGEAFLIPARAVREILGAQKCTKIPHQTAGISGVFPWNGRAIPLISLDAVLLRPAGLDHAGLDPARNSSGTPDHGQKRTLVIEANGDIVGLSVDEVREVVRLQSEAFRPVHASDGRFTSGEIEWTEGVARLLDLESMVGECFQMG
jgi:chemotaxis signal transduction protein